MSPTPGELLRAKREEKQLTLLQVSQGTNIRMPFLQALEEDRLNDLPSLAQARGFMRLYAGYLGLDANELLKPKTDPEPQIPSLHETPVIEKPEYHPVALPRISDYVNKAAEKILEKMPSNKPQAIKGSPKARLAQEAPGRGEAGSAQIILNEIGKRLEEQREALGLSRADVERQTRIREYYIYALEHGKLEELPSTVQGRGMLVNYATFMNLDSESLQLRFAEALQLRRLELAAQEGEQGKPSILNGKVSRKTVPAWRRVVTPDLIVSGGLFLTLFVFVIWGATQVIRSSDIQPLASPGSISEFLMSTGTAEAAIGTEASSGTPQMQTVTPISTLDLNLQATQTSIGTGPIQVVVSIRSRTYLKITVDGKTGLEGIVVPGMVYTFSASNSIQLVTGDASSIQVIYNQEDLGVLGGTGQVLNLNFTMNGVITPTSQFTATPTITQQATLTQQPTATPTPTLVVPTPTLLVPTP